MKKEFEQYLIDRGYKTHTPSGNPSTVYEYIKRIDFVCETEHTNWFGLSQMISKVLPQYEIGGTKEYLGAKSHNAVRCALRCFNDFLKTK